MFCNVSVYIMARSKEEYENALIWLEEAHWAKSEHYHSTKETNKRIKERELRRRKEILEPWEKVFGCKFEFVEDDIPLNNKQKYSPIVIEYDGQHPADEVFFGKKSRER